MPMRADSEQVRVSPSRVEAYDRCPLRWLVEASGGTAPRTGRQGVGSLLHDLAETAAHEGLDREGMLRLLEERWPSVDAPDGWSGRRELERARLMVERLADWLKRPGARELVGVELDFAVEVGRALVTGRVDRLERDERGRLVVVDLKTGRTPLSAGDVGEHPQLGTYPLAVRSGAFGAAETPGGASLVQLGHHRGKGPEQPQPPLEEADVWADELLARVADGMAGAVFEARESGACRRCPARAVCPAHDDGRQVHP